MGSARAWCNMPADIQVIIEGWVTLHQWCGHTSFVTIGTPVRSDHTICQAVIYDHMWLLGGIYWLLSNCDKELPRTVQAEAFALNLLKLRVVHSQKTRHDGAVRCIEHEQKPCFIERIRWLILEFPSQPVTCKFCATWIDGKCRNCA